MSKDFGHQKLAFYQCSVLCTVVGEGAKQVVDIVQAIGGTFLTIKDDNNLHVDSNPLREMNETGDFFIGLDLAHDLLERPPFGPEIFDDFKPTGNFHYLQKDRMVIISQTGDSENKKNLKGLARGQLALALLLYPSLKPVFGYIDEGGENAPGPKSISRTEVKYLFWANFFGPSYVRKFGREIFLNAPGWKKEELDDGGILYVVTEDYYQWWTDPPKEPLEYFRKQVPGIKLYRAKTSYD